MTTPPTAIPRTAADLDGLIAEARRQATEVDGLLSSLTPEAATWRPAPDKWSVAGHVAHMVLVNEPYLASMHSCIAAARKAGRTGDGPYRHPWIGSWFANSMEPPPKMRVPTATPMVPDPATVDPGDDFRRVQDRLVAVLESARGVDLGKARFSSPFLKLLRLSVGTAFHTLLAHNRRHVWLAREVMAAEGFPAPAEG